MGVQLPFRKGAQPPSNFWPMSVVVQRLYVSGYGGMPRPRRLCVRWRPSSPKKKGRSPHPIFGPCLLWTNGWMDQDGTWYGGKPRPRRRCVRWGRSSPLKGAQPLVFGSCLFWPNGCMDEYATWYGSRPRPRPHCVRRGPSSPAKRAQQPPPSFRPMSIVTTVTHLSYC